MIYYFIKKSGGGKSKTATALCRPFLENCYEANKDSKGLLKFLDMSPIDRLHLCHKLIDKYNAKGYDFKKPEQTVWCANLTMWSKRYGEDVINYALPGDKIGLYDPDYETLIPAPGALIAWDEVQLQANGRESMQLSPRVISFCNYARKWGLDMLIFSQRDIVDKTLAENAMVIIIADIKDKYDKYGFMTASIFTFWVFQDYYKYQAWKGSQNSKYYQVTTYTIDGCIHDNYDTEEGAEYFADCASKRGGIALIKAKFERKTKADIEKYVKDNPYMSPEGHKKGDKRGKRK